MKTRIIVIEDSMYKSFTAKQILESQLKLPVDVIDMGCGESLKKLANGLHSETVVIRQTGGVSELLDLLKKKKVNRRNSEITLLLIEDFEDAVISQFEKFLGSIPKVARAA